MQNLAQHINLCIQFFTRIPIYSKQENKSKQKNNSLADAAIAFPVVGFLIGSLIATTWLVANYVLPALPAAGLAITFGLLLTGALHEDGLSDCADGLGGNVSTKRALEIMRDSRIGAYGSAALIITIGLRWTSLANLDLWSGFIGLIIAHMVGRAAIVIPLTFSKYVRSSGLASSVSTGVNKNNFIIIMTITALMALALGQWQGLVAFGLAMFAATLTMLWLNKRIGGYTGDGLGAIEQVAEITTLLVFVACVT